MPVFPLEASTIVPPGLRRPSASAARTIASAVRSLTLDAGLKNSSFAGMRARAPWTAAVTSSSGVPPTSSARDAAMRVMPAG